MNKSVSIVIPIYNEQATIGECLQSLAAQTYKELEIILVDDGSTDQTLEIVKNCLPSTVHCQLIKQQHKGPGVARNLGASESKGEILVFVDADMTFDKNFIKDLVKPIAGGKTIGTFSKNEFVNNAKNIWSRCWNINRNLPSTRMISKKYPDQAPVFRAIQKAKFLQVAGFDTNGSYTDDWSLSRKLKVESTVAPGAIYYHANPDSLKQVWKQARWIGKNEFISGTPLRKIRSLILYSLPFSLLFGLFKSVVRRQPAFIVFKIVYDPAVWISVLKSFFGERKFK